jgi:DNA polymerase-3 subunit delta'
MSMSTTTDQNLDAVASDAPPPWIARQLAALTQQRGHAWLLAGSSGLGQYRLALELARYWLCDHPTPQGPCGHCSSCHAIHVRAHTDLLVLMPETVMLELGWPLPEKAQADIDDKKRKPSKEIRVEALRDAVEFSQRTSGRGRGKAVLIYPAERMNHIAASALLKTLEEPPGDVRFVLASESAHQLLPTIRSRCLWHTMLWPGEAEGQAWLAAQGMPPAQAKVLWRASGERPQDAIAYLSSGRDVGLWALFPKAMQQGDAAAIKDWSPVQAIDALHKLCHDLMAVSSGAAPRFFEATNLPAVTAAAPSLPRLTRWSRSLATATRTMEHPYNAGLMIEALVMEARSAINSRVKKPS